MSRKVLLVAATAMIPLGLALGWYFSQRSGQQTLVREARPAEILDHVRSLQAPLVLLNFWATWCEPCKTEFPHIMTVRERFKAEGLQVVFVSIDDTEDLEDTETFLKAHHVDFPSFFKGDQSLKFVQEIYPQWSGAVPATLILGPDLKILDSWAGDTSLEEFEMRIKRQLKGT